MAEPSQSGDRMATLSYICADSQFNRRYMTASAEVSTGKYESRQVTVHDIRAEKDAYTLECAGIQLVDHQSEVTDWTSMEQLNTIYSHEIRDLVSRLTGADEVIVFGPARRTTHEKSLNKLDNSWNDQPPAYDVHVDYTVRRARCLAADFALKNKLDVNAYRRTKFINLWRATKPGPQDWPLALCHGATVDDDEGMVNYLLYVDQIPDLDSLPETLPHDPMHSEGTLFPYRDSHLWMYFSDMHPEEVLLFTLYDSELKRPWRVPHCAFENHVQGAKPRESVEIRTVCFFK